MGAHAARLLTHPLPQAEDPATRAEAEANLTHGYELNVSPAPAPGAKSPAENPKPTAVRRLSHAALHAARPGGGCFVLFYT